MFGTTQSVDSFKKALNTTKLDLVKSAKGRQFAQVNGVTVAILAHDIDLKAPLMVVELIDDNDTTKIFHCIYNPAVLESVGTL